MEQTFKSFRSWLDQAVFIRVLVIGFVIILLQIPISMIENQIYERQSTKTKAIKEVSAKWGGTQIIVGPKLVIPYIKTTTYTNANGKAEISKTKHYATFLPDTFNAQSKVTNKTRYRGIFKVPLYQAQITIDGHYSKPDFSSLGIDNKTVLWDEAELVVQVSDARAIQQQVYLKWNGRSLPFEPGLGKTRQKGYGFHLPLKSLPDTKTYQFSINLLLNGSERLYLTPLGKDSTIQISANWPDPSFQGNWLPVKRTIDRKGFAATWKIPYISRNFSQSWLNDNFNETLLSQAAIGVDFISPVNNYRMAVRSIKYAFVFLLLTFGTMWLIEVISRHKVHLIQYLFIGLGMSFFYLLLVSFSEHISFGWSYSIASIAVIVMVTAYSKTALKTGKRALVIGSGITLLYGYLYTLLQEQNYSMLIGSIGMFTALALVMFLTRKIDWYGQQGTQEADPKPASESNEP